MEPVSLDRCDLGAAFTPRALSQDGIITMNLPQADFYPRLVTIDGLFNGLPHK